MVPFFFVISFLDERGQSSNELTLGMVASVVANVSGLMTGGLYLFLKSSTLSTIGPKDKAGEYENRRARYKIRRYSPNDADDGDGFDSHSMHLVADSRSLHRVASNTSSTDIDIEKEEEALDGKSIRSASTTVGRRTPGSLRSNARIPVVPATPLPKAPEPARVPPVSLVRKRTYSLFPTSGTASKSPLTLLPATTYSPADALKPPPSMGNLANMRHRRDSSLVSSATVQIGLRLSSVEDMPPVAKNKVVAGDCEVYNLDCPNVLKELEMAGLKRPIAMDGGATTPPLASPADDRNPKRDPVKDARMKTLPPVPGLPVQVAQDQPAEEEPTLSPTVYDPNSPIKTSLPTSTGLQEVTLSPAVYNPQSPTKVKLPSPKGVGFTTPMAKSANAPGPRSPPVAPPQRRATGETTPLPTDAKGAWI
jgi:hypothetical protein